MLSPRRSSSVSTIAVAAALTVGASANAAIVPFTETFATGPANWRDFTSVSDANWFASGALDGTAFISATVDVDTTPTQFDPALLRAQDEFGSSGGAFEGDWITQGVTTLSFDVRHDGPTALAPFIRLATAANFPGANAVSLPSVAPNTWTHIDMSLDPAQTVFILEGFPLSDVLSSVGHLQFGMQVAGIRGLGTVLTMAIDNVSITPAPGAAGLLGLAGLLAASRRRRGAG